MGCNYLSLSEIPASDNKVLICYCCHAHCKLSYIELNLYIYIYIYMRADGNGIFSHQTGNIPLTFPEGYNQVSI